MQDYLLLLIVVVLISLEFTVQKVYQRKAENSLSASLFYNAMLGFFTAVIFLVINGGKLEITPFSAVMALLFTILCFSYNLIGFQMLRGGIVTAYTMFLMSGGMAVPYLWGIIFWDEKLSIWRIIGLLLILCGILYSNLKGEKLQKKMLAMGILVFVLNGFVSTVSKMHQIEETYEIVSPAAFLILSGFFKFVICFSAMLLQQKVEKNDTAISSVKLLPIILSVALISGVSFFLQLLCARNIPATILYPVITGGSITISALFAWIFFHEKLNKRQISGVILCIIGTCMFL